MKAATDLTGEFQRLENCELGVNLVEKVTLSSVTWQLASADTRQAQTLHIGHFSDTYSHITLTFSCTQTVHHEKGMKLNQNLIRPTHTLVLRILASEFHYAYKILWH